MVQQIAISYSFILIYSSTVISMSLLVGLLPVYVNRPYCDDIDVQQNSQPKSNNFNDSSFQSFAQQESFLEPFDRMILPECIEFTVPDLGVEEPWFNSRLPSNIIPKSYDIELNLIDNVIDPQYDGTLTVTIEITDATDTFIVHKKKRAESLVRVEAMHDVDENPIEISCYGEYSKNDYYVFKTINLVNPEESPVKVSFYFADRLNEDHSGLFQINYGIKGDPRLLIVSKFQPIDARRIFPCFDEPSMKATFNLTINHSNKTIALSNSELESEEFNADSITTRFKTTPKLPIYLSSLVVFDQSDFDFLEITTDSNRQIRLWARVELIEEGFVEDPLQMAANITTALENLFSEVASDLPSKIDIFACPNYPSNGIGHWGLLVFREENILFNSSTAGERIIQDVALLIAEKLAELFFGNYVTFAWWDELWLQEALAGYIKYKLVDDVFPEWMINDQFVTEELIDVFFEDSFPTSHPVLKPINTPYEIEEYFDRVERSKVVGVLRMIEEETSIAALLRALQTYLEANAWGTGNPSLFFAQIGHIRDWQAIDFADRWFQQSNYPILNVQKRLVLGNRYILSFNQQRALTLTNESSEPYPSPFGWRWYLPISCLFGNETQLTVHTFDISETDQSSLIGDGFSNYEWYHCGINFAGYFAINYPKENWNALKIALKNDLNILEPIDRANLIHNLFANAFADRIPYSDLIDFLFAILPHEREYLPWRVVFKHISELETILQSKKSFLPMSIFFVSTMNDLSNELDQFDSNHTQKLLWETIFELECQLQNQNFLNESSSLWTSNIDWILANDPFSNTIDPILRGVVYKYHIQNTIDMDDWHLVFRIYQNFLDSTEKHRLSQSLPLTRIPSLLAEYLYDLNDNSIDIFNKLKFLSKNLNGRELAWTFYRINFENLVTNYGLDDPRLGQALIDIAYSFENSKLLDQLKDFISSTTAGASVNARKKAVEKVEINLNWIKLKEEEFLGALQIWNRTINRMI